MKKTILTLITLVGFSIGSSFAGNYSKQLSVSDGSKAHEETINLNLNATTTINVNAYAYRSVQWSGDDFVNSTIIIRKNGSNVGEATIQLFPYYPVSHYYDSDSYTGRDDLQLYINLNVLASPGNTSVAEVSASW